MNLREMQLDIHENAVTKGFWDVETRELQPLAWLMCCIARLCELAEKWRKTGDHKYCLDIDDMVDKLNAVNVLPLANFAIGGRIYPVDASKLARLCLIVTEIAEAAEATDKDNLAEELADTVIRCLDMAGGYDIDLQSAIERKMKRNAERPYLHGKRC